MKDFQLALQLYSVREDMKEDFEGTLKKVKEIGYDGVEFAGLFGHSASEVKKMCEELGLVPISAHVPLYDMKNDPDVLKIYQEIGCEYVVLPYLPNEYRPGTEKFFEVIEIAKMLGEKAKSLGMQLCYHNHDFEFVKLGEEYALDRLYREVDADLLQPQFDTCWVNVGGEDPAAYIRKYAGRISIVHLKDFVGCKSENMYALIGIDEDKKKETSGAFEFRPVGSGVQDIPSILEASKEVGAKWMVVEQDGTCLGKTAMECAEESFRYLDAL